MLEDPVQERKKGVGEERLRKRKEKKEKEKKEKESRKDTTGPIGFFKKKKEQRKKQALGAVKTRWT